VVHLEGHQLTGGCVGEEAHSHSDDDLNVLHAEIDRYDDRCLVGGDAEPSDAVGLGGNGQ
jgi:hypothetical protein